MREHCYLISLVFCSFFILFINFLPFDSILASATAPVASPSYHESSAGEASKISWLNEAVGQKQPDLPDSPTLLMSSRSTSLTINLQTMPVAVKHEKSSKVALHDSELCLAMGWVIFFVAI